MVGVRRIAYETSSDLSCWYSFDHYTVVDQRRASVLIAEQMVNGHKNVSDAVKYVNDTYLTGSGLQFAVDGAKNATLTSR
jgi:hypothetical protein